MFTITKDLLEKNMPKVRKQVLEGLSPDLQAIFNNDQTTVTVLDVLPLENEVNQQKSTPKVIYL